MRQRSGRWIGIFLIVFFGCTAGILMSQTDNQAHRQLDKKEENPAFLSAEDKAQLSEALLLKKLFGGSIWPGFDEAGIPLILYNERYAFLVGHPGPPPPWTKVAGDSFQANPYYRRQAAGTQAFAVRVGDIWAGSLDTLGHMNRSMTEQIKEEIPPEKLTPALIKMLAITPAHHVGALLHEAFHAYQAAQDPERFQQSQKSYIHQKSYPFEDKAFQEAWNTEGSLLASALKEQNEEKRRDTIREFLKLRVERRDEASLSGDLVAFERELEWLEGSAKYVEMQFAIRGATMQEEVRSKGYRVFRNRLQADFSYRIGKLGTLDGDLRFYLSGAALAMILDKVSPCWKMHISGQANTGLEDLLRAALKKKPQRPLHQSRRPESQ